MNEEDQIVQYFNQQELTDEMKSLMNIPEAAKDIILANMEYGLTTAAFSKLKQLMSNSNDGLALKAVTEWLNHIRSKSRPNSSQGLQINFSFGNNTEVDNVRQIRAVAGIDE